jgi:hypothetical protein
MRKLLMLAASALAALAFAGVSASSASATYVPLLFTGGYGSGLCPAVSLADGEVSGGCVVEDFEGSIELYANVPNPVTIGQYDVTFDLFLDGAGNGYAVNPTFENDGPSYALRKACDEADGSPLPWPVTSRAPDYLELEMDVTFGITLASNPPGGSCSQQQITIDAADIQLPYPWGAELDQLGASANFRDGHWESDDWQRVEWDWI